MEYYFIQQGVIIMGDDYFNNNIDKFLESRESFISELIKFIEIIRNTGNLRFPLNIEIPMLSVGARHTLHTYQKKGNVLVCSVGDNSLTNFKKMRIVPYESYIMPLLPELPQLPEVVPDEVPEIPLSNSNNKIIEYLTNIKDLIDKIIAEIR